MVLAFVGALYVGACYAVGGWRCLVFVTAFVAAGLALVAALLWAIDVLWCGK